ncbi:MAG TPA: glycosyltransferase [Gemmataceae bacterium]|nr:glycosyltransferase [Gemmataceae bacterium]
MVDRLNAGSEKVAVASTSLVSILIPCCGMIEYTKLCVPSVLRYSRPPFELIFLDIGSLDGTADYLAGVKAASAFRVEIIRTPTDLGIAEVCKEAITTARGEYVVLLNNDTVVTEGWLDLLTNLSGISPNIGLVGPMSNYAAPPQLVETVPYRVKPKRAKSARQFAQPETLLDVEPMHAFAREHRAKTKGKWMQTDRLGGFCLLIKREVLQRIGHELDKWTDLSLFDTDILSTKARQAGYTLACARDLFIHHFGTRTFSHGAPTAVAEKTSEIRSS